MKGVSRPLKEESKKIQIVGNGKKVGGPPIKI
jgi:hypothetical protein